MTGLGPVIAAAGYAGLLWLVALGLDAIGRRSARPRGPHGIDESTLSSDVARFHSVIAGTVLGVAAFVLMAFALARRDGPALLLVPLAAACAAGALRRCLPLWREP